MAARYKEYRVVWCECPTSLHSNRVLFVKAKNEQDARVVATNHIERKYGIAWIRIEGVKQTSPMPSGEVVGE